MQPITHKLTQISIAIALSAMSLGVSATAQAHTPQQTTSLVAQIAYTNAAPTIDGNVDGVWSLATAYAIQKISINNGPSYPPSSSNISANFKGLYDATNLYLLIEVTDNIRSIDNSPSWWRDDSVEVLLDGNLSQGTRYDGVDDRQLGLTFVGSNVIAGTGNLPAPAGARLATANTTGASYRMEVALPLSVLRIPAQTGYRFGLEVAVNDDDDGGEINYRLNWNDTNAAGWQNPSVFGIGELQAPPPPTPTPTKTATATSTATRTNTPVATNTSTSTPTALPTETDTPEPTVTDVPTTEPTETPSPTPPLTATSDPDATPTLTPIPENTNTSTPTLSPNVTQTITPTPTTTVRATPTRTPLPSQTPETGPGRLVYKQHLPIAVKPQAPIGNIHTVCDAYRITPPTTVSQPADNIYNIYRFTAITNTYAAILEQYASTGTVLIWQVENDDCTNSKTMKLNFAGGVEIVSPNVGYEVTFYGFFVPGNEYVIALYTKGKLTTQPYKLTWRSVSVKP